MRNEQKSKIEDLMKVNITPSHERVNSKKSAFKDEEDLFLLSIIEQLCELEMYVDGVSSLGISMFELELKWVTVIHNLLIKNYGDEVAQIIIWWVYESITPEGEVLPIILDVDGEDKEIIVKTPSQLIKFLKKYIINK
jgi:hypothetical protein